jgi:heme exporter protein CcmD
MDNWFDWLNMGKHSFYVGVAYTAFFVGVTGALLFSWLERKHKIKAIKKSWPRIDKSKRSKPSFTVTESTSTNEPNEANNEPKE